MLPFHVFGQLAGNYSIGTAGDYKSFSAAITALQQNTIEGDITFTILEGVYHEGFTLDSIENGDYFISFIGESRDSTILIPDSLNNELGGVYVKGVDHLRFRDFTVLNDSILGRYNATVNQISNRSSFYFDEVTDVEFNNLRMTHQQIAYPSFYNTTFGANITLKNVEQAVIQNCHLSGALSSIDLSDYVDVHVYSNYFIDNAFHVRALKSSASSRNDGLIIEGNTMQRGPYFSTSAIYVIGNTASYPESTTYTRNLQIINNYIDVENSYANQKGLYVQYAVDALIEKNIVKNGYYAFFNSTVDSLIVRKNDLRCETYRTIEMGGGGYGLFVNNIITSPHTGLFCTVQKQLRLLNNTFHVDGRRCLDLDEIGSEGSVIANNIFKGKAEFLIDIDDVEEFSDFALMDYNLFDHDTATSNAIKLSRVYMDGLRVDSTFSTLADWQAFQTKASQHAQSFDISFDTDSTYFLSDTTTARFGTELAGVTTDIQEDPRGNGRGIDVGADQYFIHASASFTSDISETCEDPIVFSITSVVGDPTSQKWLFGDGNVSSEPNPSHTYTDVGTYDVSLVVCNEFECDTSTIEGMIEIAVCAGLPSLEEAGMLIYPNPTEGTVHMEGSLQGEVLLEVVSIDGAMVLSTAGSVQQVTNVLNQQLMYMQKGLYIIRISQGGQAWGQRLILR